MNCLPHNHFGRLARVLLPSLLILSAWWGTCLPQTAASSQTSSVDRRLRLEAIEIDSSERGAEAAVDQWLGLANGQVITPEVLVAARLRLENSGYFRSVDLYTRRGSAPGQVVLLADVELDRSAHLETGFGHEPIRGWYLNLIGVRWNSPLRQGDRISLGLRGGQRSGGFYSSLLLPDAFGRGRDFVADLETIEEQWLVYSGSDQRQLAIARAEFLLGVRNRVAPGVSWAFRVGAVNADPGETLAGVDGASNIDSAGVVPQIDGQQKFRHARLDLAVGSVASDWRRAAGANLRVGGYFPENGASFWRGDARWSLVRPLSSTVAGGLRMSGTYIGPGAPYHLNAVVGGTGSVRGFRDASLSGALGARGSWLATAEVRASVLGRGRPNPRVVGVLFADLGDHWDAQGQRVGVSAGVGYGLRIRVPWIQVFSLDVGIPVTPQSTGDAFWGHASLGFGF